MARFKYLGEPARPGLVENYGPTTVITYRKQDGTLVNLTPLPPLTGFVIGQDIGYDITDPFALTQMRVDARFQEIV